MKSLICTLFAAAAALVSPLLAALPSDGQLDPGFSGDGRFTASFNAPGTTSDSLFGALHRSDGKLVLVGMATNSNNYDGKLALMRLLADGTPDTDFGANGQLIVDPRPGVSEGFSGAVIDSADRVLVVGSELNTALNLRQALVCRLFGSGTMDTSYGTDGDGCATVAYPNSEYAGLNAAALQPDGKLLAVGQNQLTSGQSRAVFARLDSSGALDTGFADNGITGFGCGTTAGCLLYNVALAPGGRIVAVGTVTVASNNTDMLVLALTSSGQLDTGFNTTGKATVAFDLGSTVKNDQASGVAIGADGRIAIGGYAQAAGAPALQALAAVVEFSASGAVNYQKTLYVGAATGSISDVYELAYQQDGKLLLAGSTLSSGSFHFRAAASRLLPNGVLDGDFGDGNGQLIDFGVPASPDASFSRIVFQGTQPMLAGESFDSSNSDHSIFVATRLTSDLIFATAFE